MSTHAIQAPPIQARPEPTIDAEFKAAAQARYAELRARGPVHRARILNGLPVWMVEAEVGIGTLLRRFPDLRPTTPTSDLGWIIAGMMRGPLSLPVSVTAAEK